MGPAEGGASRRRRVAVIHLAEEWVGGGEVVALASIEALKDDFDVTLVGLTRPDLDHLNALFGTRLCWADFHFRAIPPLGKLDRVLARRSKFPELIHLLRYCRSLAAEYDLMLSTFNDLDLGKPGIQYCHHPWMASNLQPAITRRLVAEDTVLPAFFASRCRIARMVFALSGYRERRVRGNLTLANSRWTARLMERAYGGDVGVVYPPVAEITHQLPWGERENGFLCVGRFVRSKRIHDVLAILDRVRARGLDVHLHLVSAYADAGYLAELAPALRERASWVHLEWNLSQAEVFGLMCRHRFGIHAMEKEHFGIAVAEMVKAGVIPFVPDSGGQVEIVAEPGLTYRSLDDAATKIAALLTDRCEQQRVLEHLLRQGQLFSRTRFAAQMQAAVTGRLEEGTSSR